MQIKFFIQLIICGLLLMFQAGCSKFLEEPDLSNYTVENYFSKPEHAQSLVNSIYESLTPVTGGVSTALHG